MAFPLVFMVLSVSIDTNAECKKLNMTLSRVLGTAIQTHVQKLSKQLC